MASDLGNGIALFNRDAVTGRLTFVETLFDNLTDGQGNSIDGLQRPRSLTVSPDGSYVYLAGFDEAALVVFQRDTVTGQLTFVEFLKTNQPDGQGNLVTGLTQASSVVVSADGNHIYVASRIEDAVSVFSRDALTGSLTFVEILAQGQTDGGGNTVTGLDNANYLVLSPDGRHLYVSAGNSNSVVVFVRNETTGRLTFVEVLQDGQPDGQENVVSGLHTAIFVTISPDGRNVYASGDSSDAVSVFQRDIDTGRLTFVEALINNQPDGQGNTVVELDRPLSVTVSPDGNHVYVTAWNSHKVLLFNRDAAIAPGVHLVNLVAGQIVTDMDFGNRRTNTAPTTGGIANVTVNEDAPDTFIDVFAAFDDAQDADADLIYTIQANTNGALFAATTLDGVLGSLTLDYTADANGTADITVRAADSAELFVEATFTVTVNPVNDAPSFVRGADQTVLEDAGVQTVAGWATEISPGPSDEFNQLLTFLVSNDNNALFSTQPNISSDGTLTYTPAPDASGTATVTVTLQDGGGTNNGGQDSSTAQTSTITVLNLADLSGRVFDDQENNGLFDGTDSGLEGVTVELFNETDFLTPVATRITNADGKYTFVDLLPGTYRVVQTQPVVLLDGKETAGSLGGIVDNTQDSNVISGIVVAAGDPDAGGYFFAEIRPSRIQGLVWEDFNNDGEVDFGEKAIENVTINLTGTDDRNNPVNASMITDAQGIYEFFDLRPGNYAISEVQPAGFVDGIDSLGTVNGVPTGSNAVDDVFSDVAILFPELDAVDYNFGERPQAGESVSAGQTATIGFWQNKNGQNLIKSLNGGSSSTQLADWLAATFPNMYGANAGVNDLTGKTNSEVAEFYKSLFKRNHKTAAAAGPPKLDAQVLGVALAVYMTNQTLAGTTATDYGFLVTEHGVGVSTYNVGDNGTAFGVADNTEVTVLDLLLATDERTSDGLLYDIDDDDTIDALEELLRGMANEVFSGLNEQGDI